MARGGSHRDGNRYRAQWAGVGVWPAPGVRHLPVRDGRRLPAGHTLGGTRRMAALRRGGPLRRCCGGFVAALLVLLRRRLAVPSISTRLVLLLVYASPCPPCPPLRSRSLAHNLFPP